MSDLWYNNPSLLLDNLDQFFPAKNLNRIQKINSLARLSIYFSVLILALKIESKYFLISILLLLASIFTKTTETFTNSEQESTADISECQKPTKENPFMNFTVSDLINNPDRPEACQYDDVKDELRKEFRSHVYSDNSDMWGKYISDRNFYTMPNTNVVNDQIGFAKWCFGNSGECKTFGTNCLKQRDPTYHRGRLTSYDDELA